MLYFMTPLAVGTVLLIGACALAFAMPDYAKQSKGPSQDP